ncbi:MAG: histidine kinase [Bacteroidales bacterium]|nr:histidine kinase [Bacteroidales bacterium]
MSEKYIVTPSEEIKVRSRSIRSLIIIFLIAALFILPQVLEFSWTSSEEKDFDSLRLAIPVLCVVAFCINYYLIVPRALTEKKAWLFFGWNLLLTVFFVYASLEVGSLIKEIHHARCAPKCGDMAPPPGPPRISFLFRDLLYLVLAVALAYAIRVHEEREYLLQRRLLSEANVQAFELKYLRTQLNPHFLFNTLNNIYALTSISSERAGKAILDLSAMLRYLIHESNVNEVSVRRETEVVRDFIALSRLRLESGFPLTVSLTPPEDDNITVPPLVLLTLTENAFKHCDKSAAGAFIDIDLRAENDTMEFVVRNSYRIGGTPSPLPPQYNTHGIGLANIRQQLSLLYGEKATLVTEAIDGIFTARLIITASHSSV